MYNKTTRQNNSSLSALTFSLFNDSVLHPLCHLQTNVINEIARILKPGGKAIIVDAAQPNFDGSGVCTLDGLPSWGEATPIYRAYLKSDLEYDLIKV